MDYLRREKEKIVESSNIVCIKIKIRITEVVYNPVDEDEKHYIKNSNLVVYFIYKKVAEKQAYTFKTLQGL